MSKLMLMAVGAAITLAPVASAQLGSGSPEVIQQEGIPAGVRVEPDLAAWETAAAASAENSDAEFAPGEGIVAAIEQSAHKSLDINHMEISLIGERTTRHGSGGRSATRTEAFHSEAEIVEEGAHIADLDSLRCEVRFALPEDAPATTEGVSYPRISWSIQVHTDIPASPDYKTRFPFRVSASDPHTVQGEGLAAVMAVK